MTERAKPPWWEMHTANVAVASLIVWFAVIVDVHWLVVGASALWGAAALNGCQSWWLRRSLERDGYRFRVACGHPVYPGEHCPCADAP